ncbi:SCO family protein [Metabacillus halosaccharovorans]|uniref:SCO family protein n=1 Tax=Metabacillus halosaccharovorans TaxID=930124 RepID=UPI001C1FF30D|nr:SCO family protein [Metabacillus halosaccharovorans]MBU7593189.1 redoxin domain-containing protein [Metabacillus halosaccharovorans]
MLKHKKVLILILGIFLLVLTACGNQSPIKDPLNYEVQSFSYTNQNNEHLSLDDLKGTVWVANFIFTNCETVCPPMTAHMSELQQKMKNEGVNARIISFSVDPENDTPEKIKEFTAPYSISFENWDFLTGYSQKEIEDFARESFKTIVQKPKNSDQVLHGTSFYVVDQNGVVMKDYNGVENPPYDQMIKDIKTLTK